MRNTHPALPWQVHPSSSPLEGHANRRRRLCLRWCLPTRTGSGGNLEQQEGSWAKLHLWHPWITAFHQLYASSLCYILNIFILGLTCQRNYRFFALLFPIHVHQQPWQGTWQISKGKRVLFLSDTTIAASIFHIFVSHMSRVNSCIVSVWALMHKQPPLTRMKRLCWGQGRTLE